MPRPILLLVLLALPLAPGRAEAQRLEAPAESPADEPFAVRVAGLPPGERVTLRASVPDSLGRTWSARAVFRAGANGGVDTAADAPVEGSYAGIRALGLLTSMDVDGESRGRVRFVAARTDSIPVVLTLERGDAAVDSTTVILRVLDPRVETVPVNGDGFAGLLYVPAGDGPFPAALVLGGSEGGIGGNDVAALLAGRGIAALAIAYFGWEDLPGALREIPLEAFTGALDALLERPETNDRVAIVGTSKGAEAALLVAARDPRVRAVVAYAPSHVAWSCICDEPERSSWTWRGEPVPAVPPGRDPSVAPPAGTPLRPGVHYAYRLRDAAAVEAARIEVERIDGPILLVAGEDDQLWPSAAMAREIASRRAERGAEDVVLIHEGAGHLIGKAYLPAGSTLVAGGRIETGGSPDGNATAQGESWRRVLEFLDDALDP